MKNELVLKFSDKAEKLQQLLKEKPEKYWNKRGEQTALTLFQAMAQRVPAYKDFLKKNAIDPKKIKTIEDFKKIPVTNKQNYLLSYKLADLCWDGIFKEGHWMISSTSGSTGEPFYFPRSHAQDDQFTLTAEICLREYFEIHKKSTLFLDCFALGVWIGGMFMYQVMRNLVNREHYNLSVITPGADKTETLKAIQKLAPLFDQVIIGGYGPLVKDLVDDGIAQGIDLKKYNVKYFFAAEGFTENFRDYIAEHGGASDIHTSLINHYGTADLGTMSHETPTSILIRRKALENKKLFNGVFKQAHRLPTLTQYIPELFFFEEVEGRLLCSGRGGFPLLRYDLKDRGGVCSMEEMEKRFEAHGVNLKKEIKKQNIEQSLWNLPFVYLYERTDFVVGIYSVNIYPESIRKALEDRLLRKYLTGKFSMLVDFDKKQNQFLEINIELKSGVSETPEITELALKVIVDRLNEENSEWKDFYEKPGIGDKVLPRIISWPYQDPKFFKPGGKQKWVKIKK